MKPSLVLIIFLFLQIISGSAIARDNWLENRDVCEKTKGYWRAFNNDCADICDSKFEERTCTHIAIFNCDCGSGGCWDGGKCVSNKAGKALWEEQMKVPKEKRLAELKDLADKIAANAKKLSASIQTQDTQINT